MYSTILVPLDGTEFGERALPAALGLARRAGARVLLEHVQTPRPGHAVADPEAVAHARPAAGSDGHSHDYLEALRARIEAAAGVPVETEVRHGPVGSTLAEAADEAEADVVVMATHAHTGLSRFWHRGAAAYLTRRLDVPLLLIRDDGSPVELDSVAGFRHVLLPLDGSAYSERIVAHVIEVCRLTGARCTLLRVIPPPIEIGYTLLAQDGHVNTDVLERSRGAAERYLAGVAERLRAAGVDAAVRVEVAMETEAGILRAIHGAGGDVPVDLVAMETHGLGGVSHVLGEGMVARVLHDSPVPLLVHHDAPAADRAARGAYEDGIRQGMGWGRRTGRARGVDTPPVPR